MNIIFAASDKFVKPAMVMIDSLIKNNPGNHNFFFMYNSTKEINRNKIKKIILKNHSKYNEIYMNKEKFARFPIYKRFGYELYFRLLMPYLLPNSINRVLCIDCDIVVNGSIESIYNLDFKDNYLIAAPSPNEENNRLINNTCQYVGGGVVIYNVKKIKSDFSVEKIIDGFISNYEKFPYLDQDFLNVFYNGRILKVDIKYNFIIYRNLKISSDSYNEISRNIILHFPGRIKPWNFYYGNKMYKIYWKYARHTLGILNYLLFVFMFNLFLPFQFFIKFLRKYRKNKY